MSIAKSEIESILRKTFPDADITLKDLTGGQDHWQASIKAKEFRGLTIVAQHQLVYRALGDLMKGPIHALALQTSEKEP